MPASSLLQFKELSRPPRCIVLGSRWGVSEEMRRGSGERSVSSADSSFSAQEHRGAALNAEELFFLTSASVIKKKWLIAESFWASSGRFRAKVNPHPAAEPVMCVTARFYPKLSLILLN